MSSRPPGGAAADESLAPRLAGISRLFDELTPEARTCLTDALTALEPHPPVTDH